MGEGEGQALKQLVQEHTTALRGCQMWIVVVFSSALGVLVKAELHLGKCVHSHEIDAEKPYSDPKDVGFPGL